ncbi:hypothetical protein D477_012870 [Arthrobacter crystallopoietes BAB-32]|uniref:Uncharacterized protein n=1 Tax=Arthrobacter crystallopoietes BAB-32 TaxID=1246476 RepID=N1V1J4_9MICC|nr:hypothetical protein [Arthrobacter crystallopoietes]EMY33859.1 hypothetical protein D477_012870 [Arthrobacter crystallopoietes BAB-32]
MIADHSGPEEKLPRLGGRQPLLLTGGTQALQRTVNCRITVPGEEPVLISIPNTLGALVLKGAAYREDSRDIRRHLDDAAVLLATVTDPLGLAGQLKGSDRSRIRTLQNALIDPLHESWLLLEEPDRQPAMDALSVLAADPPTPKPHRRRLGSR